MNARKVLLLLFIFAFGGAVETAWSVRNHFYVGPLACRVFGGRFSGPSFTFEDEDRRAATESPTVEITNAFGSLEVSRGEAGELRTDLRKVVYLPTEEEARRFASRVRLLVKRDDAAYRLSTNRREVELSADGRGVGFETHLRVTVPPGTRVQIRSEHGRVEAADVAEISGSASFDTVRVQRVAGAVELNARHGDVSVAGVGGSLTLSARHGDLELSDVAGPAKVTLDHGNASVASVGSLTLALRHGNLSARGIRGDLIVRGQHGEMQASDISGRTVVETSFDGVRLARLGGEARVQTHHGAVEATDVRGPVWVQASFGDVTLDQIDGPVDVHVEHGGLKATTLRQGGRVKASGDDVMIEGFRGGLAIEARRGSVQLVPVEALVDPVSVTTLGGGIRLQVPPGSRFDLAATAVRGDVEVRDLPGLERTDAGSSRAHGRLGQGGSLLQLSATRGDVVLEGQPPRVSREP